MQEGSNVLGLNTTGEEIKGIIEGFIKVAKMAIVRTGEDRLDVTICNLHEIKEYGKE